MASSPDKLPARLMTPTCDAEVSGGWDMAKTPPVDSTD